VLRFYEQFREDKGLTPYTYPLFYHLAAVALLRTGHEREARQTWNKALEVNPSYVLAQQNLDDLDGPIEKRNAPWAFPLVGSWIPQAWFKELNVLLGSGLRQKKDSAIQSVAQRFLQKHLEVVSIAPDLLDRGGPDAREFIIGLAMMSENPDLLAALQPFAFGQRGSDELRMRAAEGLSEHGLLPSGSVQLWLQGEWRENILLNFEITDKPESHYHSSEVQALAEEAFLALKANQGEKAQALLEKAIALEPNTPSLYNNLGMALGMQGHIEQSYALIRDIHTRFPDYFFGTIGVARLMTLEKGDLETVHQMLNGLMEQNKMHISEFVALCEAQMEVYLAEKNPDAARAWLEMWEKVDADNPLLEEYRLRINRSGGLQQILSRYTGK
jgi:tetratricopeptide (TPR) repeat protein